MILGEGEDTYELPSGFLRRAALVVCGPAERVCHARPHLATGRQRQHHLAITVDSGLGDIDEALQKWSAARARNVAQAVPSGSVLWLENLERVLAAPRERRRKQPW